MLTLLDLLRLPHQATSRTFCTINGGLPGGPQGSNEILTGVLAATVHGPLQGPGARLRDGFKPQATTGVDGQPCTQFSTPHGV